LGRTRQRLASSTAWEDIEHTTVQQASERFRVSRCKMSRLIGKGMLETKEYLLDWAVKPVRRSDAE